MVEGLIQFAARLSNSQSAIFFWVGPDCEIVAPQSLNLRPDVLPRYAESMSERDPLHIRKLKEQRRELAVLSHDKREGSAVDSEYEMYLRSIDIGDEVDLVFWRDAEPCACLSLMRAPGRQPFSQDGFDWAALLAFMQSSLSLHWRVRSMNVQDLLIRRLGLNPRELEVVRYVLLGKSNSQLAEILGISIQTVKTHIVNILDKIGVDSRLGIACRIHSLQGSHSFDETPRRDRVFSGVSSNRSRAAAS
jgi:DNA-binding CsgD family transcriptional regulator